VAAAERIAAHVVGDGRRTVRELVSAANADPRRGVGHRRPLTRLREDDAATDILAGQGLGWADVPEPGRHVRLAATANLSAGGTAVDRTDEVHPLNAELARDAALIVGLDVAGVDVVTPDIGRPLTEDGGAMVEVNAAPGFRMHTHPSEGQPRDVGRAVVDLLFPPGAPARVPIVAVTGTNGKTTTTRMVAHLLRAAGHRVGLTTTDGIYLDGRLLEAGDSAGPGSARALLRHPRVEAAALETARGGLLREGLGFDACDVAIVTNIASDHLGLGGVETLEDLARVKAVVPASVRPGGASVLNADDPLVVAMAGGAGGEVVFFGGDEANPILRDHLAAGGRAGLLARPRRETRCASFRTGTPRICCRPRRSRRPSAGCSGSTPSTPSPPRSRPGPSASRPRRSGPACGASRPASRPRPAASTCWR
jgi:cyanophycin synthetase